MEIHQVPLALQSLHPFPVLGKSYLKTSFTPLDLSVNNQKLESINVSNSNDLQRFIWNHIKTNNAKIAYGGYLEKRGIYNRSSNFNQNNPDTERNIHLGVDLWIEALSPVYAPLDGQIHSFKDNDGFGNYGPTLIIKHNFEDLKFYTLYGHLTHNSIANKYVGQVIRRGEQIASLGSAEVNGDYPPHLHFQIILDMQNFSGDYPGVSSEQDLNFYKKNCPDGKILLGLK